jgi:hypothetical protein
MDVLPQTVKEQLILLTIILLKTTKQHEKSKEVNPEKKQSDSTIYAKTNAQNQRTFGLY